MERDGTARAGTIAHLPILQTPHKALMKATNTHHDTGRMKRSPRPQEGKSRQEHHGTDAHRAVCPRQTGTGQAGKVPGCCRYGGRGVPGYEEEDGRQPRNQC